MRKERSITYTQVLSSHSEPGFGPQHLSRCNKNPTEDPFSRILLCRGKIRLWYHRGCRTPKNLSQTQRWSRTGHFSRRWGPWRLVCSPWGRQKMWMSSLSCLLLYTHLEILESHSNNKLLNKLFSESQDILSDIFPSENFPRWWQS